MSGTKAGGLKAAAANKARHGEDYYARIGANGGRNGHTGGFAADRDLARIAGAKGGMISRRGEARRWFDENEDRITMMLNDGLSYEQIASKLNVKIGRVYYSISKYGV